LFKQVGAVEDEGDGDTLAGAKLADVASSATTMRTWVRICASGLKSQKTECRR